MPRLPVSRPVLPALAALLLPLLLALAPHPAAASELPPGFALRTVAAVPAPTALAFLPDGRGLVATQPGQLRVLRPGGGLLAAPALDLSARACTNGERGLLGVAVDPAVASNGWVYLFWTRRTGTGCPTVIGPGSPVNRVSRYTLVGDRLDPASERVLADHVPSAGAHNAGDLAMTPDGLLHVSVGDGMCQLTARDRCAGLNGNARRLDVPLGKVLRLTRTGGVPAGNPYAGSRRCTLPAGPQPGTGPCAEIFATGLRNPFRMAVRPGTSEVWVNDVGQATWEEVNALRGGADYGWNVCEGRHAQGATSGGCPLPGATPPVHAYDHSTGCGSITGGAFVPGDVFGPERRGAYLYADYVCGTIFERRADGSVRTFLPGLGGSSAVDLAFGPHSGRQALFFLSYAGGGAVHRVERTTSPSAPVAVLAASGTDPATRTVRFDGSGSYDPDGGDRVVQWRWTFGDGTTARTNVPQVSHRYPGPERVTAQLRVVDTTGTVSPAASLATTPGGAAPVVTIGGTTEGSRYAVGDRPLLTASVRDAEDGPIDASTVRWTVLLHHRTPTGEHTHPRESAVGPTVSPAFPPPEDLAAAAAGSHLEVRAAATDSDGVTTTASVRLLPRTVGLTFASTPTGRVVTVNGERVTTPRTVTSWVGWRLTLAAPDQPGTGGTATCTGWSDGSPCARQVVTPATATTYRALFTR